MFKVKRSFRAKTSKSRASYGDNRFRSSRNNRNIESNLGIESGNVLIKPPTRARVVSNKILTFF